jgi:hypothetical protein
MLSAALRGNPYGTRHTASVCSGLGRLLHSRTARNAHRPNARAPLSIENLVLRQNQKRIQREAFLASFESAREIRRIRMQSIRWIWVAAWLRK